MYKRLLLNNKISATFKLKTVTFCFFVLSFQFFWTQTNVVNNPSNDTIVVLITAKNKELCEFVKRAEKWLKDTTDTTKILKWELKAWVGTPADFGRK